MLGHKKTVRESGIFEGYVDIHAHTLCGVDDGAANLKESEQMLTRFKDLGVKKCVLTPHIMAHYYNNSTERLTEVFNSKIVPLANKLGLEVALGAEYMLDEKFTSRFADNAPMLTIAEGCVLVETSMSSERMGWKQMIYELNLAGYTAVLAHPERYHYLNEKQLREIKHRGTMLQLNFLSLQGFYGKRVMDNARELLKAGVYDLIASDVHYLSMIHDIENLTLNKEQITQIKELVENNRQLALYNGNT